MKIKMKMKIYLIRKIKIMEINAKKLNYNKKNKYKINNKVCQTTMMN